MQGLRPRSVSSHRTALCCARGEKGQLLSRALMPKSEGLSLTLDLLDSEPSAVRAEEDEHVRMAVPQRVQRRRAPVAVRDIHARAMTWPVAAKSSGLGQRLSSKQLGRSWLVLPLLAQTQLTAC